MKANLENVHASILEIATLNEAGTITIALSDIPEVSEKDWPTLKAQLFSGKVKVRQMAISPMAFEVLAANSDRAGFKFFNIIAVALPILGIGMAFIYSLWFVLPAIGSLYFFKTAKSMYQTVIFQGVTASEMTFCFLFSQKAICLLKDDKIIFRNNN